MHYIYAGDGLFAIYVMNGENDTMYYVHKDYQGSYDVITDEEGDVVERLSFDPWGRRRNAYNWTLTGVPSSFLFDRGYTGHEHLDVFSLINMNGRCYDPWLGRFLSPDPIVQSAGNSQSYNRYSYCLNNPLKYVDPSGYLVDRHPKDWKQTAYCWYYNPNFTFHSMFTDNPSNSGSYSYNWSTGNYENYSGTVVSWNEVFNNYVIPNSCNETSSDGESSSSFQGAITFGRTAEGTCGIARITLPHGIRLDIKGEWTEFELRFLDDELGDAQYVQGETNEKLFESAEAIAAALFIADHSTEQFIKASAIARTYYTTITGGTKYISKTKLLGICEVTGRFAFGAAVLVNFYGASTGEQSWLKAGLNVGVEALPLLIGTGPGLALGIMYFAIDYTVGWDHVLIPAENHPYIYYGVGGVPLIR